MKLERIVQVAPTDEDRALALQSMAFAADPVMRWLFPDPKEYLASFPGFARVFGGRAFEHDTAFATGEFGGISLWLPPGVHADGDAVAAFFRANVADAKQDDLFETLEQMDAYHIDEPHWYLAVIGVDPAQQGQGLGAALLAHTLSVSDEQGLPAYLESSNPANISLYQRHGFEVLGEIRNGAAPTVYPMLRQRR